MGGNPLKYIDPLGLSKKDKWYGYNDKNFRDWVHKQKQDMGLPGNKNFTKDQLKELYDDWNDQGCPGGKGAKSGGGKGNKLRKSVNRRNPFAPSPDRLPPGHTLEDLL